MSQNRDEKQEPTENQPFSGFGLLSLSKPEAEHGIFILVVYREGTLTAAAHATEQGAMQAALEYLDADPDENDAGGTLEDRYTRSQEIIADEGGLMEIIPSPLYGG